MSQFPPNSWDSELPVTLTLLSPQRANCDLLTTRVIRLTPGQLVQISRSSLNASKNLHPSTDNAIYDCKVMSREHGILEAPSVLPGPLTVRDTSKYGTFLNDRRIEKHTSTDVLPGDRLRFGDTVTTSSADDTHRPVEIRVDYQINQRPSSPFRSPDNYTFSGYSVPEDDSDFYSDEDNGSVDERDLIESTDPEPSSPPDTPEEADRSDQRIKVPSHEAHWENKNCDLSTAVAEQDWSSPVTPITRIVVEPVNSNKGWQQAQDDCYKAPLLSEEVNKEAQTPLPVLRLVHGDLRRETEQYSATAALPTTEYRPDSAERSSFHSEATDGHESEHEVDNVDDIPEFDVFETQHGYPDDDFDEDYVAEDYFQDDGAHEEAQRETIDDDYYHDEDAQDEAERETTDDGWIEGPPMEAKLNMPTPAWSHKSRFDMGSSQKLANYKQILETHASTKTALRDDVSRIFRELHPQPKEDDVHSVSAQHVNEPVQTIKASVDNRLSIGNLINPDCKVSHEVKAPVGLKRKAEVMEREDDLVHTTPHETTKSVEITDLFDTKVKSPTTAPVRIQTLAETVPHKKPSGLAAVDDQGDDSEPVQLSRATRRRLRKRKLLADIRSEPTAHQSTSAAEHYHPAKRLRSMLGSTVTAAAYAAVGSLATIGFLASPLAERLAGF
ncbi:hypothetical protein CAC42_4070 [Sphaceloma murrayae]|uniref:FHA domain-containing protein n=1 Tax=Sphaceloma murrayae TaxID=2082308 RepID=A0A2K1QSU0_9PEZI|nr:hypothetical protein CAC42_4070 [Sphaceloma murrayae]